VLGNPVDYNLFLLAQAEAWKCCLDKARQRLRRRENQTKEQYNNAAIMLASFDRILEHTKNADQHMERLVAKLASLGEDLSAAEKFESEIAQKLAVRSRSIIPACASVLLYVWQVAGAFDPFIGASPNPSGGRVAYALLPSGNISKVLLSNTIGSIASGEHLHIA
jgi:hypothetical protein